MLAQTTLSLLLAFIDFISREPKNGGKGQTSYYATSYRCRSVTFRLSCGFCYCQDIYAGGGRLTWCCGRREAGRRGR